MQFSLQQFAFLKLYREISRSDKLVAVSTFVHRLSTYSFWKSLNSFLIRCSKDEVNFPRDWKKKILRQIARRKLVPET
jgi:hypothetical protein